jgi:nitrile hydratase subunit beta
MDFTRVHSDAMFCYHGCKSIIRSRRSTMNGVHDMGGMHGFGPIEREENEPVFHAEWEGKVRALMRLAMLQGYFNIDAFRYGIERMPPAEYLNASYYERWLATVEYNLAQVGVLTEDEVEARVEALRANPDLTMSAPAVPTPAPPRSAEPDADDPGIMPRFAPGDHVRTRNTHPTGHTRLPRYVRGKRGVIRTIHGVETWPDSNAHGRGADPRPLYSVRFDARDIWGESTEGHQAIFVDLWEPYLDAD